MSELAAGEYDKLLSLFSDELGTVRDIYVTGATLETWDSMLGSLGDSPWAPELRLGDRVVDLLPASEMLREKGPEDDTFTLRVTVGEAWLWCHFFSAEEIEFSFQAEQIASASSPRKIIEFMSWLSGAVRRDVKLTLEAPGGEHADPIVLVNAEGSRVEVFPP